MHLGKMMDEATRKHNMRIKINDEQVYAIKVVHEQTNTIGKEIITLLIKVNDTVTVIGMEINTSKSQMMTVAKQTKNMHINNEGKTTARISLSRHNNYKWCALRK